MGRGVHSAVCPSVPSEVPGPEVMAQGQQRWAGTRQAPRVVEAQPRSQLGLLGLCFGRIGKKKIINYLQMHILEYL